ncbi:ZNF71 isoform 1, partial [Pan troglodytes]
MKELDPKNDISEDKLSVVGVATGGPTRNGARGPGSEGVWEPGSWPERPRGDAGAEWEPLGIPQGNKLLGGSVPACHELKAFANQSCVLVPPRLDDPTEKGACPPIRRGKNFSSTSDLSKPPMPCEEKKT